MPPLVQVKSFTGCEKATVIAGRLEFWFSKYHFGFYKFLEPCGHRLYRAGDSWSEELGFSRKVFNRAFALIGVRYKSKSEFMSAEDKFQGKLYASYHDRKTNRTYFVRNHALATEFFGSRGGEKTQDKTISQLQNQLKSQMRIKTSKSLQTVTSSSVCNTNSVANTEQVAQKRAVPGTANLVRSYNNNLKQKKTPSLKDTHAQTQVARPDDFEALTEGMIMIWKEEVGELGVESVSQPLLNRLYQTLSRFFSGSLEVWRSFCRKIASSKFLMGEAKNRFFKKAWITWAIKEESIELIHAGHFNCGDREIAKSSEVIAVESQIQELRLEKDKLLRTKSRIEDEVRHSRKAAIRNAMAEMTAEKLHDARDSFEVEMQVQDTITGQDFRDLGWNMPFAETLFEMFLMSRLESQLFPTSLETQIDQDLTDSGIQLQLEQMEIQESQLIAKRNELTGATAVGLSTATNRNEFSSNADVYAAA